MNMELKDEIARLNRRLDQVLNSRNNAPSQWFFQQKYTGHFAFYDFRIIGDARSWPDYQI